MDRSNPPAFTRIPATPRWQSLLVVLALLGVVLIGAYFRMLNLSEWDGDTGQHPDERYMHYTVVNLSMPRDWRTYFVSTCPDPLPAPRNPQSVPQEWEPSAESRCSTLNPRNFNWSRGYVYGTLPTTLTRIVVEALGRTELHQIVVAGRALSAGLDLITLLATFSLASLLYGRRVGLLAALLYASAVTPIQQSHFFTVDQFAVCFGTLALLFTTRLALRGGWLNALLTGVFIGAAAASKINMAALVVLVPLALLVYGWRLLSMEARANSLVAGKRVQQAAHIGLLLLVIAFVTFAAFRVFQPDAFSGPNIWDIKPEPRFIERMREARLTASGEIDLPSSHQWANRTPWLFPWQNMVLWGMGAPLGIAAWLSWAASGIHMVTRRHTRHLLLWFWIALYFGWQGGQFVTTMRYFLPIYPPLIIFGAWGLVRFAERICQGHVRVPASFRRAKLSYGLMARGALVLVISSTLLWAWAYTRIYTRPYTRVAAAEWIKQAAPNGAKTTWELWDDPLPLDSPSYTQLTTQPYAEEEIPKYLSRFTPAIQQEDANGLINQLAQADYVVLTSPRVYNSVARVPQRFPVVIRYYESLFDGSLGFELAADIHSFPTLGNIPIKDLGAEEAFFIYDHPRVLIFRRTASFSIERARQIIDGVAWGEIYRGLRPAQISQAPTALQLSATAWDKLQSADMRYLFASRLGTVGSLSLWLLAIEFLGLAAGGLIWKLKLPLPDRGLGLGRMVGLAFFALPPALLGTTQIVGMQRVLLAAWYGVLLGCGVRLLWQERRGIAAYIRVRRWTVWIPHLLYLLILVLGLLLQTLIASSVQTVARWTALVRSVTLPPPDLFFAGGHDPLPYAAQLPFTLLNKLLGIQPSTGLQLALATALALALVCLWSAVSSSLLRRPARSSQMASMLWAGFALLLITLPGLLLYDVVWLAPWYALARQDLDTLGLAALMGTTLALGVVVLNDWQRRAGLLLLLPLLALVYGYGIWITAAVWLTLATLAWVGLSGNLLRWLGYSSILLGMLALGYGFAWSVAPPALEPAAFAITTPTLLLGLIVPLGVLLVFGVFCSGQQNGRRTGMVVASAVGGWVLLAGILRWPIALLGIVPFMACAWLATQAWLLGRGPRRWRTGAVWAQSMLAIGLFMIAGLMMTGKLHGDAQQLFVVATILLIFAASRSLPLLRSLIARRLVVEPRALMSGALCLLLLAAILSIGPLTSAHAIESAPAQATPAMQAALGRIASTTPGAPVVVGAPQAVAEAASINGLPALIAAPDAQQRLRDVLQPSISAVIAARLQAVSDIYSGDIGRAQQALQIYHVGYVLLGPDEQAAFPKADLALRTLAQHGVLEPAYEQARVRVYHRPPPSSIPPFVTQPVTYDLPSTKTLLLDQPVNQLPVVDEYGWNQLAAESPALGIIVWLLLIQALGLLAFPLASVVFGRWHDRGWGVSKLVGLLVWGYAVWMPVSLGWWHFNWWSLVWGASMLAGLSALVLVHQRRARSFQIVPPRSVLLRSELCFLGAWSLWALVRAANPDLWHPIYGGEKPFEFGFLNAILRSPVLPPYDPFFSGGIINYYYYGLFLVALPIKATGIDPAVGFNLAIATLLALTTAAALGLGRQITGRWRYGLLAVGLLVGIGPLASAFAVNESRGLAPVIEALHGGLAGFGGRLGAWFWGPSRIIPYTINEFPLFSFLFADLHPHLIALPIMLLGLACVVELGQRSWSMPLLALSTLVLGTLAVANSWDAPTYALLLGGVLVGRTWQRVRGHLRPTRILLHLALAASVPIGVALLGLALYMPFFLHYRAMVGGLGLVHNGDSLSGWLLWFGPSLFVIITLLGSLLWYTMRRAVVKQRAIVRAGRLALPLLLGVLLLSGWVMQEQGSGLLLRLGLALLAGIGLALLLTARLPSNAWLPLWLITVGLLVALGVQFVFVRDHLAGGTHERMNTVFKFGFQIWTLWAVGAATALPVIIRLLRRYQIALGIWLGFGSILLLPGLLYPLAGIPSQLSTRFDPTLPLTLDGLAFMQHAHYSHEDKEIDLRLDAEAIEWLKQNIKGTPIFLTSEREFYRAYGMRIAANTGLPTVLGRLHEDEQRPPEQVAERDQDVQTLLNTTDLETALQLLAKYHVDYVYIGPVERALYDPAGIAKWEHMRGTMLDLVYENDDVQIYRVKPEALANAALDTQPPQLTLDDVQTQALDDVQTQALEAQAGASPEDAGTAFGLAERYIEIDRFDDAARVLEIAARAHPDDVPLYHLWGDVLAQLGRDDEAIRAWGHAAEVQRTPSNLNKLGQGLVQLRRWDEAERAFHDALELDRSFVDAYFSLGELYRNRNQPGDRERAVAYYQRYLQHAPADALWRDLVETYIAELK